jgi:hypothetical protein
LAEFNKVAIIRKLPDPPFFGTMLGQRAAIVISGNEQTCSIPPDVPVRPARRAATRERMDPHAEKKLPPVTG